MPLCPPRWGRAGSCFYPLRRGLGFGISLGGAVILTRVEDRREKYDPRAGHVVDGRARRTNSPRNWPFSQRSPSRFPVQAPRTPTPPHEPRGLHVPRLLCKGISIVVESTWDLAGVGTAPDARLTECRCPLGWHWPGRAPRNALDIAGCPAPNSPARLPPRSVDPSYCRAS